MNSHSSLSLLSAQDPAPVAILNPGGRSSFLLIGDHAGNLVPGNLGSLGIDAAERVRHIAWDIGVAGLGERLSAALDAVFVRQVYSRLVIDCNRDPAAFDAMPEVSDGTVIPANAGLTAEMRAERVEAIHAPYQAAIANEIARLDAGGQPTALVSLHSFTPSMRGYDRPWHIGVLHDGGNVGLAMAVLHRLRARGGAPVGDNQPYAMDGIDYTIPRHAFAARLPYVEIEIRQDLLVTAEQQAEWAAVLAPILTDALTDSTGS